MRADSIWINRIKKAYRKRARNAIVIDILGGGAGLLGVFFSVRMRGDITILTDVSGELCKFAQDYARIPIHFLLPLCEHETTQSLLTQFYGKDHPAHSRIGIALATEGMAQCGGMGACAGMDLLGSRLFAELLKNLSDQILKLSGGNLHHLWLRSFGSGSGGTYSLFEVLLTAALVEHLTTLGVTIKVSFFMVDSMAFVGLGQNIHKNQACALAAIKDLIRTNATTKNDKVIYELRLIGTPPTGTDTQLRQEYKLLDQQAWLCPEMLQHLQVGGHNGVVVGPYGNICHTSTDFFRSIPRRLIASTVATEYYFAIKEGVEAILPMRDFIVGIEPNHIVIDSPRTAIPSIVDDCDRLTTNDM